MLIHNAILTGSISLNGSDVSNITGSAEYSASFSSRITNNEATGSTLTSASSSFSTRTTTLEGASGSFSSRVTSLTVQTGSYATTGSNTFTGAQIVQGSLTAQTLIVQTVTSSVLFSTGSNKLGSSLSNVQELTGSVGITGSLTVVTTGTELQVNAGGVNIGNALTDNHVVSGSVIINPNGLFVSSSGVVGVGTISPLLTATDRGNLTINGVTSSILTLGNGGVYSGYFYSDSTKVELSTNTQPMTLVTNGVERMRILSGGSVGIGTSSPAYSFEVKKTGTDSTIWGYNIAQLADGTTNATGFRVGTSTSVSGLTNLVAATNNDASQFAFWTYNGSAWGERMRITSAGNVAIGRTSADHRLDLQGNALIRNSLGNASFFLAQEADNSSTFYQYNNSTLRNVISSNGNSYFNGGNVGIGTSSPSYTLHVNGTAYAVGHIGGYVSAFSGYVNETQTITTNGTSYYLRKYTGNANGSSSTVFNITGLNTANGTFADIYAEAQKDATGNAINTNLEVQINGQYMVGIQAGGTSANTVRNAFRVCRMESSWIIIGTVRS